MGRWILNTRFEDEKVMDLNWLKSDVCISCFVFWNKPSVSAVIRFRREVLSPKFNQFQSELFRFRIKYLWFILVIFVFLFFSFYSFYGTLLGIPHCPGVVECAGVC